MENASNDGPDRADDALAVPTHDELIAQIDAFQARHPAMTDSVFSRRATGEPGLVERLRRGSSPTLKVLNRIAEFMADTDDAARDAA